MHVPFMWLFVSKILLKYSGPRKTPLWKLVLYSKHQNIMDSSFVDPMIQFYCIVMLLSEFVAIET